MAAFPRGPLPQSKKIAGQPQRLLQRLGPTRKLLLSWRQVNPGHGSLPKPLVKIGQNPRDPQTC